MLTIRIHAPPPLITATHHRQSSLPIITANHHCQSSLPIITANHHCLSSLPIITANQHCQPALPTSTRQSSHQVPHATIIFMLHQPPSALSPPAEPTQNSVCQCLLCHPSIITLRPSTRQSSSSPLAAQLTIAPPPILCQMSSPAITYSVYRHRTGCRAALSTRSTGQPASLCPPIRLASV
jgi:hypothetical protein